MPTVQAVLRPVGALRRDHHADGAVAGVTRVDNAHTVAPRSAAGAGQVGRRALVAGLLLVSATAALAANNTATGDVAGDSAALADSNTFVLSGTGNQLTLVKRAFLADGTPVPTTSTVPRGTVLEFMIYISNDSAVQIQDISLQDVLAPGFAYVAGTLRVDNSEANCATPVCNATREGDVFTAVSATPALDDAASGTDVASYTVGTTTVDIGRASQANAQLNIAGSRVWALLFSAQVQ